MTGLSTEQMRVIRAKFKPTGAQVHEVRKQMPNIGIKEAYRFALKANLGHAIEELNPMNVGLLDEIKLVMHGLVFFAYYGNETGD